MPDTPSTRELLLWLASAGGAGLVATWLVDQMRRLNPPPATEPTDRLVWLAHWLLWSRLGARLWVMLVAFTLSVLATSVVRSLDGAPALTWDTLDTALAAIVASQLAHARTLSSSIRTQE